LGKKSVFGGNNLSVRPEKFCSIYYQQEKIHMKIKAVETAEGAGARVNRVFPNQYLRNYDPFVLLDEFFVDSYAGFPYHKHRGFEAVTYMLGGAFRHRDNIGNDKKVLAGGVQRFTAGSGIVHSEMPGNGDISHGLQLWVNLPRRLKRNIPTYQQVDGLPEVKKDGVVVRTIVGKESPVELITPVLYRDIKIENKKSYDIRLPKGWKGFIYVLIGETNILKRGEAFFTARGITIEAKTSSRFVFIAGKPHNEPIRHYGPFVE
jgi:redox-sensitive bicupin YhaK (pirin superfamily)